MLGSIFTTYDSPFTFSFLFAVIVIDLVQLHLRLAIGAFKFARRRVSTTPIVGLCYTTDTGLWSWGDFSILSFQGFGGFLLVPVWVGILFYFLLMTHVQLHGLDSWARRSDGF